MASFIITFSSIKLIFTIFRLLRCFDFYISIVIFNLSYYRLHICYLSSFTYIIVIIYPLV